MKRYLSLLLTLALLFVGFPATAANADATDFTAYCEFCQEEVAWTLLSTSTSTMSKGHYYIGSNMTLTAQNIKSGSTVCLNLNGKKYISNKPIAINGTLNIQGSGTLVSRSHSSSTSGSFNVKSTGVLNVRNATFTYELLEGRETYLQNGGIFYIAGTANLEGCKISDGIANATGGNAYITSTGRLNLTDCTVQNATAPTASCIYSAGTVQLSGATQVDNILIESDNLGNALRIEGDFAGRAGITLPANTAPNTDIGDIAEGSSISGVLSVANAELNIETFGTDLILQTPPAATVNDVKYDTVEAALAAADTGDTVILGKSAGDIAADKEVTFDLNGRSVQSLTAADSITVSVIDTKTADFNISDGDYGKIGVITGNVTGGEDKNALQYLPFEESDGTSFHALRLEISSMALRGAQSGLYFTSHFEGDTLVAQLVDSFGVAMRLYEEPDIASMEADGNYTVFTADQFNGASSATSSLVTGILKRSSSDETNERNASTQIYGRPYIKLTDGSTLLGVSKNRNLKDFLEAINNEAEDLSWLDESQQQQLFSLYQKYPDMMSKWDTDIIHKAWEAHEESSFKVLAITSSFGLNTTQFFREIAIAEGMENATIARAYAAGCTLQKHVTNMEDGIGIYDYSKNSTGKWSTRYETSLEYALNDEYWDIIYVQQSAAQSPILSSYNDAEGKDYIDQLMAFVTARATNPNVKYVWNMTWAYQGDSTQKVFAQTFNGDQMAMYNACVSCVQEKVVPRTDFCAIIPSGTAIQNARTSYFGDTLTKDTYHLNNLGRVIAGYTMYATLTGKTLTEINIGPVNSGDLPTMLILSDADRQVIIECVNNAIANPWGVTPSSYPTAAE